MKEEYNLKEPFFRLPLRWFGEIPQTALLMLRAINLSED